VIEAQAFPFALSVALTRKSALYSKARIADGFFALSRFTGRRGLLRSSRDFAFQSK